MKNKIILDCCTCDWEGTTDQAIINNNQFNNQNKIHPMLKIIANKFNDNNFIDEVFKSAYQNTQSKLLCENLCQLVSDEDLEIKDSWNANTVWEDVCGTGRLLWWQNDSIKNMVYNNDI